MAAPKGDSGQMIRARIETSPNFNPLSRTGNFYINGREMRRGSKRGKFGCAKTPLQTVKTLDRNNKCHITFNSKEYQILMG
tara:strand:+ start:653 stop:895 length:243 start_codon:yes stop_codon:yes gene_type:complete